MQPSSSTLNTEGWSGGPSTRRLWQSWLAEGWQVTECVSSNPLIQLLGDTAVFCHDVTTTINTGETTLERETIIFHRSDDGSILAVHEHLSPLPPSPEAR